MCISTKLALLCNNGGVFSEQASTGGICVPGQPLEQGAGVPDTPIRLHAVLGGTGGSPTITLSQVCSCCELSVGRADHTEAARRPP